MPENPWYVEWFNSPFYYKLYSDRNETEATNFVKKLLHYLNPPEGSRMLDVACGRGRYSKVLADMGFDVTGTDLSPSSIEYAKQFEHENLKFFVHDLRLPFWINYFDYVFNFFSSFGYFRTRREHEDAIRTICQGLKENGTLVIDFLNVHHSEKKLLTEEVKQLDGTVYHIHRWEDDSHFFKKIRVEDPKISQPLEFTEELTKLSLKDFTDMLSNRGMQIQSIFGDYQLNTYDIQKSPRLIIVSKKTR